MKEESILEYSDKATNVEHYLENGLGEVAAVFGFTWKTPPHDLARQLMNHIVEFQPMVIDKGGGA